jgi:putative ABC transport system permease protein
MGGSQAALGGGLARLLGAKAGDLVAIEARTRAGAINALQLEVSGIVNVQNPAVDALGVWLPLPLADDLVRPEGARSHVALRVGGRSRAAGAAAELSALPGWTATTASWESRDLLALNDLRRRAISFVVFILMAIAGTGIANTVIMAAYERVREIGTLRAMGMSAGAIRALFLLEGAVLGLLAGVTGAVLGSAVAAWFSRHGIDLSKLGEAGGEMSFSTVLYMRPRWPPVITAVSFGAVVGLDPVDQEHERADRGHPTRS